jgi:hypothetical protein
MPILIRASLKIKFLVIGKLANNCSRVLCRWGPTKLCWPSICLIADHVLAAAFSM